MACLYLPPRSYSSTAVNRFFCSLQSHTGCKIHLRRESQRNVWAIITLHICGSFFQSSWEFQQSWAIRKKTGFSPQMTSWSCYKVWTPQPALLSRWPEVYDNLMHCFFKKKTFRSQNKTHAEDSCRHVHVLLMFNILLKYRHCESGRQQHRFCTAELPGSFCLGIKSG